MTAGHTSASNRRSRRACACMLAMLFLQGFVLLACEGSIALPANSAPRWACASVTPRPTTIKASVPRPTTTPDIDPGTEDTYYQPWEQEYGLPILTPTPYTKSGNFYLGQRIEVYPLHALVTAERGALVGDSQL